MGRHSGVAVAALAALSLTSACRSFPKNENPKCIPCSAFLPPTPTQTCPVDLGPAQASPTVRPTNLVFQGGGVKGAAYAGALTVMGRQKLLAPVKRVAGTSAGSIVALMVALGYTPQEISNILFGLNFNQFRDGGRLADAERLVKDFGFYKGNFALCFFECLVERKSPHGRDTTFAQLHELHKKDPETFKDLRIFGTNVDTHLSVEFSHSNPKTAGVRLADAARISMSIPYFFASRVFDGDIYVDGGVLRNYPIRAFDSDTPNEATLGLHLGTSPSPNQISGIVSFTKQMFATLMDTQTDTFCQSPADIRRSVFINPLGISATDFGLSFDQKCALFQEGSKSTQKYLSESRPATTCPVWLTELRQPGKH